VIQDLQLVVLGAGGLGCPAVLGLCAAGARRVVVVDHDVVDATNLHRQVLYDLGDVGANKAEVAASRLRARGVAAEAIVQRISPATLDALLDGCDADAVVLECSDAPALKFAVNDACVARGLRLVLGAALGLRGHAIAVVPGSACYRCVFEAPPPDDLVPTCAAAGVLGTAVGTTGFFMAHLAAAIASDRTDDVAGRLFELGLASGIIRALAGRRRDDCACAPHCRTHPGASHGHRSHPDPAAQVHLR
jgi:adenylyltransferase/sulfurtransferase